ncbi:MAG TPA: error-prone DNA polymerase [Geminicoccus sp.]|jgi:error-prone DNA polymerase|uniref:error-prone DNA polymerase n=1 Tax=Geminicoccus sp. TaxID=2024832 RepID=UPI002E34198E|nr:error-prone DNA polymerase [Geminicoccus sp.]HEX2528279.1 error-prone DNA polymerase [Geminicoccus sp.]
MTGLDEAGYVELGVRTNFSFLEGASHPDEMILQAKAIGLPAIGIADRNTLAGIVRAYEAARKAQVRLLVGCRLAFLDRTELIVFPRDRPAYGRLCRLLSIGKTEMAWVQDIEGERIPKGETKLRFDQAWALGQGMIALVPAPARLDLVFERRLTAWAAAWPDRIYLAAAPLWRGDDRARLDRLAGIAHRAGVPLLASNAVLYHHFDRRPLQDVLTCIRKGTTIDAAGFVLQANAERYLKPPAEMARLFRSHPEALARTVEVARACTFSLKELAYDYPDEPVPPGWTPQRRLVRLACAGARQRWRDGVPAKVTRILAKELRLIRKLNYAPYFLTVHDIVAWARHPDRTILCQGRGSAANSAVCYCLEITNVDPVEQDVLIERFISAERQEPPDIDVDFEHERRELVMQYVYERYGRDRAAIVATVIHYRPRSAIRDVGKALGLTADVTARLADTVWGSHGTTIENSHVDRTGLSREDVRLAQALALAGELIRFPRHLSQHVGGFVLTRGPLVEIVPVGNGAMKDRTFIEWDKDDIDVLNIMKVDILALGMLTALKRGFALIEQAYGVRIPTLANVPRERKRVYRMLQRADSVGVFQVESRAQMAMLPRLRPECFYDLVVQVAIVRPGPIQGKMVHPYLQRRVERRDKGDAFGIDYPHPAPEHGDKDELRRVLHKTLGVPLFQEQAMRIAMVAAKFTGDEANGLRRAMATFRHVGTIGNYEKLMVDRMIARGYEPEFAQNCFQQIQGFGEYGFPESHAASFAHLVYVSAWMKCDFPDVFAAALLNSQPMGFYAPAQIVRDAREHGVEVRHPDVGASDWDATLEQRPKGRRRAVRLGMRSIDGFRQDWAAAIVQARQAGPFTSMDDLRNRTGLVAAALDCLAAADALGSLGLSRRQASWAAKGTLHAPFPLFAATGLEEADGPPPPALPNASPAEEVVGDYQTLRLSLKGHPVGFLRQRLAEAGALPHAALPHIASGRWVSVGGVVLVRQRPGSAKGVVFLTIEDETGIANIVLWPKTFEAFRPAAMGARMLMVRGRLQREDGVTHLVAEHIEDWTDFLRTLADMERTQQERNAARRHPRNVRTIPPSRDFH